MLTAQLLLRAMWSGSPWGTCSQLGACSGYFFMFQTQLLTNILEQCIPQDDDALGEVAFPFICSKFTKQ